MKYINNFNSVNEALSGNGYSPNLTYVKGSLNKNNLVYTNVGDDKEIEFYELPAGYVHGKELKNIPTGKEIWYTSTDGEIVTPVSYSGLTPTSNTYMGGKGVMTFESEVATLSMAFYECTTLATLILPDTVSSIGGEAFYGCSSLTSVSMQEGVTSIGFGAFSNCYKLSSVNIPSTVTSIAATAFAYCYSLPSILIPSSVTSIKNNSFGQCYMTADKFINNSSVEGYPYGCTIVDSDENGICIKDNAMVKIRYNTSNAILPDTVITISSNASSDNATIASLVIPTSVTTIGKYAFARSSSLSNITFKGTMEEWAAITKEENWNSNIPATVVHCSDGDVTL